MFSRNVQFIHLALFTGLCLILSGCGSGEGSQQTDPETAPVPEVSLPADLMLPDAPDDAASVATINASAQPGDSVVIRGYIGGRAKPVVSGRAIMTVVDASLSNQCMQPSDGCETPWDYCCASPEEIEKNIVTVQIVDDDGMPLKVDLMESVIWEPKKELVIRGVVASRPTPETVVLNAEGVFIESKTGIRAEAQRR